MKTELTKEQSLRLIEFGVPERLATGSVFELEPDYAYSNERFFWCFTLTDLLEILPKEIYYYGNRSDFNINHYRLYGNGEELWWATYSNLDGPFANCKELIDALYELTVYCLENGHLKFN